MQFFPLFFGYIPETNSSHLKIGHPKRKLVFQPSIFRGYFSFREGKSRGHLYCQICASLSRRSQLCCYRTHGCFKTKILHFSPEDRTASRTGLQSHLINVSIFFWFVSFRVGSVLFFLTRTKNGKKIQSYLEWESQETMVEN